MRTYSERSLQSLTGVHPDLRRVIDRALQDSPLDFIVIEGLRTKKRQEQLVAEGASKTLDSRHLTGHAVDLLPIGSDGKPAFAWPLYDILGPAVKAAANVEGIKIEWGGDWENFRDGPHFQLNATTYPKEAYTGKMSPLPPARKKSQSTTLRASGAQIATAAGTAGTAIMSLSGVAQYLAIGFAGLSVLLALYIMRERLKKWAEGDN